MGAKHMTDFRLSSAFWLICMAVFANGAVEPMGIFSDSMVLQRDLRIAVWGWASVGEQVTVVFNGQTVQATARDSTVAAYKGYWKAWLQPMSAGGPYDMTITGSLSTPIVIKSVLIGDVWVCCGQSNMWYTIDGEYAADNSPDMMTLPPDGQPLTQVRMCRTGPNGSGTPALDIQKTAQFAEQMGAISAPWRPCSRANARQFSATANIFGLAVYRAELIPIGLILTASGGTSIKLWMPPELSDTVVYRQCGNKPDTAVSQRIPTRYGTGAGSETDGALFAGEINPIVGFGIKGVIWWQGEEEACDNHPVCYYTSGGFRQLIRNYRRLWGQGDFPFIYNQLQNMLDCSTDPSVNDVHDMQDRKSVV
jgi:sialate O-acetylesterase